MATAPRSTRILTRHLIDGLNRLGLDVECWSLDPEDESYRLDVGGVTHVYVGPPLIDKSPYDFVIGWKVLELVQRPNSLAMHWEVPGNLLERAIQLIAAHHSGARELVP